MTKTPTSAPSVFGVTARILNQLESTIESSSGKAVLAELRNSIGRGLSATTAVWPIFFENLPEDFLSRSGIMTIEEKAILTTLQLYALHQQGKSQSVISHEEKPSNFGQSLASLRTKDDTTAIDRRFNALITADSFEEFTHYLRQMVSLLKAKSEVTVNYAQLANDLYWFQRGCADRVRLRWGQSYYYRPSKIEETANEEGEKSND